MLLMIFIHFLFWCFIFFYEAVMDTLTHHFGISIFKNLNYKWWDPNRSFLYVKPFLGTRFDAWHIVKYLMWSCAAISLVTYSTVFNIYLDCVLHLIIRWIIFELFYSYILLRKN